MLNFFKNLFKSKEVSGDLALILARDDCSRFLADFGENELDKCRKIVIVAEMDDGSVQLVSSQNTSAVHAAGMLAVASRMVQDG